MSYVSIPAESLPTPEPEPSPVPRIESEVASAPAPEPGATDDPAQPELAPAASQPAQPPTPDGPPPDRSPETDSDATLAAGEAAAEPAQGGQAVQPAEPTPPAETALTAEAERARRVEQDAREGIGHARQTREDNRRTEYAEYLARVADGQRAKVLAFGRQADAALVDGSTLRAEHLWTEARRTGEDAAALESKADRVRAGEFAPERVEAEPAEWIRVNDGVGTTAVGGVGTGDRSAITGDDLPPPIDHSRAYGTRGGLRVPLAVQQLDLEYAMPRDADGRVHRLADPRMGEWFALANHGGPQADPTRGLNCVDGVLSLFETYVHGRPRVSAPRAFDSYAEGDPTRPLGAEDHGLARIEQTVGGEFQGLCPYVGGLSPEQAKQAVDAAMTNLHNHLYNAGHGSFAFIVTDSEEGTAHAWAAVNQGGTILFLDPQTARLSEDKPLYTHAGQKNPGNVVSMDAAVTDGQGRSSPLPYHHAGLWSHSSPEPPGDGGGLDAHLGQTLAALGVDISMGTAGALGRLDPDEPPSPRDPDFARRVEEYLRGPFAQDPRIDVAVVDGREVGLTIDAAVRGIRQTLGFWRGQGHAPLPERRMIVFTGDGGSVVWRGDTGTITVSV